MTGDVLAKKLMDIRSDIPIIVCTGYSDRMDTDVANDIGIRALIMKPVAMKDMASTVRRVLDESIKLSNQRPAAELGI
jgi:DNA-binding NarL/FixJ family response regulator